MGIEERKERERLVQRKRRRKQIISAAKKVFLDKGFSGATMEDVAREAELSSGTLYLYFSSKDELYATINVELQKFMQQQVQTLADNRALTAPEKVKALSDVLYQVYEFDPLMMRNVLHLQASETLQNLSAETIQMINGILSQTLSPLSSIIAAGIREGSFENHQSVALVDIVWAMFSGLVLWEESKKMFDPRKDHLKPTLNLAMEIFCKGISSGAVNKTENGSGDGVKKDNCMNVKS
ncbi:MAG: TetR/AcrR family transcriptional regulator [Pseudomonadota bacterium]